MPESIYELEGRVYRPLVWAGSPWSPSMQHGGPVIALFAREAESVAGEVGMQLARLTVDLFKPVPMVPLVAETRRVREGKRITAVESVLHPLDDEAPVCRASSLLLRPAASTGAAWSTPESPPPPFEATTPATQPGPRELKLPPGFHDRVEIRAGIDDAGPFVWMTTTLDLVSGERISPLQRAAALTDMTLGTQMRMALRRAGATKGGETARPLGSLLINADTTVYFERPIVGDHLALRPALLAERDGIGTAEAILYDADGRVGRSLQSALAQRSFGMSPASDRG